MLHQAAPGDDVNTDSAIATYQMQSVVTYYIFIFLLFVEIHQ